MQSHISDFFHTNNSQFYCYFLIIWLKLLNIITYLLIKRPIISFLDKHIKHTIPVKYHILFWLGYFTFNLIRWGSYFDYYLYSFKSNLVEFSIHIIIVYGNIFYLIPKYVLRKKYKTYVAIMILILAIALIVIALAVGRFLL